MSFKRDIINLQPAGIVQDLPPDAVGAADFNYGKNVTFRDGIASRTRGWKGVYPTPTVEPEILQNLRTPLVNYWAYGGRTSMGATDGVIHADVTPAVGFVPTGAYNQWTASAINDAIVMNHAGMNPVYWKGGLANKFLPLPNWLANTKCQSMRASRYHLFGLNVTDVGGSFQNAVIWSDAAEAGTVPQSWTPTPSNQAGNTDLSAGGGFIVDGRNLRDTFYIYKNNAVWSAQYVGGNAVFAFRKVMQQGGLLARNCIVDFNGLHVVLTESDVILFDGNEAKSIIDKRNKRFLFSQIDPANYQSSFVVYNSIANEVWICFPTSGNLFPNMALVWCADSDSWGVREIDNTCISTGIVTQSTALPTWDTSTTTWDDDPNIWDAPTYQMAAETLLGASDNLLLYSFDADVTNNGIPINSILSKSGILIGKAEQKKLIKRVFPRIEAPTGTEVTIRIGGHDLPNGTILWSDPVPFIIGSQEKVDSFAVGRYLAFEISSESVQPWRLTGLDIEYNYQGSW